jgi:selenocysteine lyase/cysteine desulfurase
MAREFRSRERQSADFTAYQASALGADGLRRQLTTLAAFFGVEPDDLALNSGSTEGLNTVARGLDLQPGDEVLTTTHDRPAAVYPWLLEAKRRGIKVRQLPQEGVPASPESIVSRFAGAITPQTKVMAFAHVQSTDGTVMPVRELCALARSNGIFSVVDGAQGPGLLDLRLADLGCDAYATSFHRWLNAPHGTGALFLRREARPRLWPLAVEQATGWDSRDRFGQELPPGAAAGVPEAQAKFGCLSRYQGPSLEGIAIAIDFQQTVNRARIGSRIRELASYLRSSVAALPGAQVLSPGHPALSTGIVSLRVAYRDHASVVQSMAREDRIAVAHVAHGTGFDAIRVSLHAYNDHDEIERLVNALRRRL